jgi:spore coat protein JC
VVDLWIYEKKLFYPVDIQKRNPRLARLILNQYGGADGEIGSALRYMSQRFTMVEPRAIATLNDIATEELAHFEIIGAICWQLSDGATQGELRESGMEDYYIRYGKGVNPETGSGLSVQSNADPLTDLYDDMAAERRARSAYERLLDIIEDPSVSKPIQFLRQREIVHFQRFGECLQFVREAMRKT